MEVALHYTLLVFSLNFPVPKNLLNEVGIKQKILLVIFAKIQLFISHFWPLGAKMQLWH